MKTMKFLAVVLLAAVAAMAKAQTYSDHIDLGVGAYYERQLDGTFAYEHETKYHNSWEYFFNYSINRYTLLINFIICISIHTKR